MLRSPIRISRVRAGLSWPRSGRSPVRLAVAVAASVLVLLLILLLVLPTLLVRGAEPQIIVSGAPAPGARVVIDGNEFPPGISVGFRWDEVEIGPITQASSRGAFSVLFDIPRDAEPGRHTLAAVDVSAAPQPPFELATTHVNVTDGRATVTPSATPPMTEVATTATVAPTGQVAPPRTSAPTPAPTPVSTPQPAATPTTVPPRQSTPVPTPGRSPTPTAAPTPPSSGGGWANVLDDQFNGGGVPAHWNLYNGPYGSGPRNCAVPSHASVSNGSLQLLLRYESSGRCGAGWYSAGMMVDSAYGAVDQRVTVRFRIVRHGVAGHYVIPMRWPTVDAWPQAGEEDYCEGNSLTECTTFLHYSASNQQIYHHHSVDLSTWHTIRVQRREHVVRVYIDDMSVPRWTYQGSAETLPDTFKRVVLQQECQSSCPSGTTGSEVIEIDWIRIDNAV